MTLLPKPNKSSGKLPYLDLPKIISGAPSIQKKCNIPLSNEAKLKISDLKDEFSQDIKEALTIFSQRVNLGYLDLIQSHLDVSHETLAKWYTSFKDIESKLKELCRVEDFQKGWEESITRLKTFHNSLQTDDLSAFLKRKIENVAFLESLTGEKDGLVQDWVTRFDFNIQPLSKGHLLSKFKTLEDFHNSLRSQNFNPGSNLKDQIHTRLKKPHKFFADYTGKKQHSGSFVHEKELSYEVKKLWVPLKYEGDVEYSGLAEYSGFKDYIVTVTTPNCTHNSGFFNVNCKLCSHHDIDITFNGVAPYSGSVRYKGKVEEYSRTQEVLLDNVNYKGTVSYKDTLKYQDIEVPYKGSHEVTCQDHHSCACDKLASLVLEAKALYEDIEYYRQVMTLQKQYLKSAPEDKETLPSPASSFSLDETNLLEGKREHKALTDIIHQKLKKVHTFEAEYKGTAQYTVPIRLPETKVPYTALIPYDRTIEYKDEVPYSGTVPYSGSTYYSTTYRVKSCYDPCGWCEGNVVSINKTYSDTVQYSGITAYAGKQKINEQVKCKGTTKHEGSITYSDVVEHKGSLPYSGTHKVSCEHDHHDCSCETYASWVSGLTVLLKAKEEYRSIIENLKTTLTQVTLEN